MPPKSPPPSTTSSPPDPSIQDRTADSLTPDPALADSVPPTPDAKPGSGGFDLKSPDSGALNPEPGIETPTLEPAAPTAPSRTTRKNPPIDRALLLRIEAILYLKARPLRLTDLIDYAQCDREAVQSALIALMEDYSQRQGALEVVETSEGFSLQLRSGFEALVQTLIPVDLGVGALRTLAAIALKKGITQTELVDLRGSGAYQQVQALVEQGFVQKRRHKETRSYWLQVTDKFHRYFQTQKLPKPLSAYSRTATSNPPPALDSPEFEQMPLETEELADDLG